jgi:hypothetical protein
MGCGGMRWVVVDHFVVKKTADAESDSNMVSRTVSRTLPGNICRKLTVGQNPDPNPDLDPNKFEVRLKYILNAYA